VKDFVPKPRSSAPVNDVTEDYWLGLTTDD